MTRVRISQQPRPSWGAILKEARYLARLALPIVISLAAAALIGVVDTVMVAPLGTLPLAAVSITASVLIIFYSALYGRYRVDLSLLFPKPLGGAVCGPSKGPTCLRVSGAGFLLRPESLSRRKKAVV